MIAWFYSLPRATLKGRLFAAVVALGTCFCIWLEWSHLHDDLAIARYMAWFFVVSSLFYLPRLLVVVFFGRVPKLFQHFWQGLSRTPSEIYRDKLEEVRTRNANSRRL